MTVQRGAVVIVDWPFTSGRGRKPRPALIVQNDRDNHRLHNTILAMITSTTRRALEPTQLYIDITTTDGNSLVSVRTRSSIASISSPSNKRRSCNRSVSCLRR